MNLQLNHLGLLLRSLIITLLFIPSCKKPELDLDLIVNTNRLEATVSFEILDASTGMPVSELYPGKKIKVSLSGENKDQIVNNAGSKNITAGSSFLTLGVLDGTEPSNSNPIRFNLVVHADGYLSTSVSVRINEKGDQHLKVYLVNVNDTPGGVAAIQDATLHTNSSGETTETLILSTPDVFTSAENTGATVTIPAGTKLLDANMQPVTGTISTTLVYFNNQDEEALRSFPGGFAVNTSEFGDIVFKTAGFVAMEMKNDHGDEVKNFSQPIQMNIEIPAATTNTEGQAIQQGMSVPIWSYTTESGKWRKEGDANISYNNGKGQYETTFEMIHLSYWNLDWFQSGYCSMGAKLKVTSDKNGVGFFKLKYPDGSYYYHMDNITVTNGQEIQIMNGFPGQPMKVEVYSGGSVCDGSNGTLLGSTQVSNLCSGTYPLQVNFSLENSDIISKVTLTVDATCASKPGQRIKPTASIYASDGYCCQYLGQMVNGKLTTPHLKVGKSYYFWADYGGYWYSSDLYQITSEEMIYDQVLPIEVCNKL